MDISQSPIAHGKIPYRAAYRAFDRHEYATEFLNGHIRFGNLCYYRGIEDDARRDRTEGESPVQVRGTNKHAMFASTVIYGLCLHKTIAAAVRRNPERHLVAVRDPMGFAQALSTALERMPGKYFGGVEGCDNEYTKGQEIAVEPSSSDMARLAFSQRPERFSPEAEFRFVIIRKRSVGDFLTIRIADSMHFLSSVEMGNRCQGENFR